MKQRERLAYWGFATCALLGLLWLFGGILAPFFLGVAIAYIADPLAKWLEAKGLSRVGGTLLINAIAFAVVFVSLMLLVPVLFDQTQRFLSDAPGYVDALLKRLHLGFPDIFPDPADGGGVGVSESAKRWSLSALKRIVSGGLAFVDFLGVVLIAPIVAFYLLLDWDRLIATIDSYLPRQSADTVRDLARQIDKVLSGFLRGQLSVCLILGASYALALSLIGLKYGLLVGIVSGIISFIPFVGSIVGLILSVGLALAQSWGEWRIVALVVAVFIGGQLVEGNFLTPYLVGGQVGLHPVWLIFALSAFGTLFGFAGLLIAVPAAAAIGVLVRWGLQLYQQSGFYTGKADEG